MATAGAAAIVGTTASSDAEVFSAVADCSELTGPLGVAVRTDAGTDSKASMALCGPTPLTDVSEVCVPSADGAAAEITFDAPASWTASFVAAARAVAVLVAAVFAAAALTAAARVAAALVAAADRAALVPVVPVFTAAGFAAAGFAVLDCAGVRAGAEAFLASEVAEPDTSAASETAAAPVDVRGAATFLTPAGLRWLGAAADRVVADSGAADPAGFALAAVVRAAAGLRTGDVRTVAGFAVTRAESAIKGEETAGSTAPVRASDGCPSGSEFGGAVVTPLTYQGQSDRAVSARNCPK
ncbi:hypothetical protein GY21_15420 [Cryobacterium roopkundense]|nr:hypothetical protein GY21_15420 [Cryobacterium roopkundense]